MAGVLQVKSFLALQEIVSLITGLAVPDTRNLMGYQKSPVGQSRLCGPKQKTK